MNLANYFNPSRFWLLLKMELFKSRKGIVMTLVISFGLLFVGMIIENVFSLPKSDESYIESYTGLLMIGGFVLSSLAFSDLGSNSRRTAYLMLPVSTLEKFVSMWLLTTVGWIMVFSVIFMLYIFASNAVLQLIFPGATYQPFQLFEMRPLQHIRFYFVLQGIFLVGATQFRGYVFPKTIFTLILLGVVCGVIGYFIMANMLPFEDECMSDVNTLEGKSIFQVWMLLKWMFWWLLMPLCWVTTYLGLKEQEV